MKMLYRKDSWHSLMEIRFHPAVFHLLQQGTLLRGVDSKTAKQLEDGDFQFACTCILRFMLLMWGQTNNRGSKNFVNQGYLVVQKGRKIG